MDRIKKLSVIIVTYNNYTLKNGCIEAVLFSILHQKNASFEIIVVDNCSDKVDFEMLSRFIMQVSKEKNDISVKLITNYRNNISAGRNKGAASAKNDILVFMDDDMFLINNNTLSTITEAYHQKKYGYSAIRYWSDPKWYEKHKSELLFVKATESYYFGNVKRFPEPCVRKKKDNRHLVRTYIGNFGYIDRELLCSIGGWNEEFSGYGLEDDYMALLLYLKIGRPFLLEKIEVLHIWHTISEENYTQLEKNKRLYDTLLNKHHIKKFHTGRLLYDEEGVIEPLD